MRVLILSDLQGDLWAESGRDLFTGVDELMSETDHILLAGYESNKPTIRWMYAFERRLRLVLMDCGSVFWATKMNGDLKIRVAARGYRKLRPSDLVSLHKSHLTWLNEKLKEPFTGRTYVAAHHAPYLTVL